MQSKKWQNDLTFVHFQGKPFNITVIQVYAPTTHAEEAEVEWFHARPSTTNTKKICPFHHRGLECKSRESMSNRQVWPWSTKWSRAKANRVLSREHAGHSKHGFPTTEEMTLHMNLTRTSVLKSDWLCSLKPKMARSSIQSAETRHGADCGSDHELLMQNSGLSWRN